MKRLVAVSLALSLLSCGASLFLFVSARARPDDAGAAPRTGRRAADTEEVKMVSPALDRYTQGTVRGDLWKRPGLSARDRSIVTLAALVARNHTAEIPYYLNLALDSGVKPGEVSELITHLAFYSGWGNAMSAVAVAKDVFAQRKIGADQLPPASPDLLP